MNTLSEILQSACNAAPVWQEVPAFRPTAEEFSGIQAITYDGLETGAGKTTTFAYLGIPESDTPVPAIVLVHGGGGQAFLPWVKLWMDRGYAAIAMTTRGCFPAGVNGGSNLADDPGYRHGMYDCFVKEGYVDSPNEDSMSNPDLPIEERWITHALVKVIRAHNLLRSLPQVDSTRIGVTGISWGGIITSLTITHDPRFAFAIPIYGSGYLSQALTYMGPKFSEPGNAAYRAEDRFDRVKMPVLWLAWNDDNNFSANSNSLSYLATAPNNPKTCLSLLHDMGHSHPAGWEPAVSYAFADWIVKGGRPLVQFVAQPEGRNATATLAIPQGATNLRATLYYLDGPMTYSVHDKYGNGVLNLSYLDPVWQRIPATVSGNTVQAELPAEATGYYLELCYTADGEEIVVTSAFIIL